jgi:hypothetical protein
MKLLLDFDGEGGVDFDRFKTIVHVVGLKVLDLKAFKTARGIHLYLDVEFRAECVFLKGNHVSPVPTLYYLPYAKDLDILLLQTLFGSDYRREAFNYTRVRSGISDWNVLFAEKWGHDEEGNKVMLSREVEDKELEEKLWAALERLKKRR